MKNIQEKKLKKYIPKNPEGRPVEFDEEIVKKLEEAFAIGASISEACFYANISRPTYYNHVKEGTEIFDRFEELKEKPILKARQTIIKNLDNVSTAQWFLERKTKEFRPKSEEEIKSLILNFDTDQSKRIARRILDDIKSSEKTSD